MPANEIRALTGLRGVAACYVVLYHFHAISAPDGLAGNLIRHGYVAVDLFFVLSGFLMGLTYGDSFRSTTHPRTYAIFLVRRLARIYPLHACVTLLLFAASALAFSHTPLPDSPRAVLISNLLMIQSWGVGPSINIPAWSISTEWAVYLLFPLLAGAILFSPARVACAFVLVAMAGVAAVALSQSGSGADIRYGPLDVFTADTLFPLGRCLCDFTLGLFCFRLECRASLLPERQRGWLLAVVALCIVSLLAWPKSDILLVPLFAALVLLLARGANTIARALASSIPFRLGVLSYAIYLLHGHMYEFRTLAEAALALCLPADLARNMALLAAYVALLIAAWLAFTVIERPGRRFVRKAEHLLTDLTPSRDAAPISPR